MKKNCFENHISITADLVLFIKSSG